MNNSNFGNDCRNNINNCNFKLIYDKVEEISSIQKYASLYFNDNYKDFAFPKTITEQINTNITKRSCKLRKMTYVLMQKKYCTGQKCTKKLMLLIQFNFDAPKNEYSKQGQFSIVGGEMVKTSIMKTKFTQTNDKRFYYLNRVTLLSISHPVLKNLNIYKEQKGEKIEKYVLGEKIL